METVAESLVLSPFSSVMRLSLIVTTDFSTVTRQDASARRIFAVIVQVPDFLPVTTPYVFTLAMAELLLLKVGRLPEDFIEGMACVGGCVGGPSKHKSEMEAKKSRDKLIGEADKRGVHENLKNYDLTKFSMHRHS